VIVHAPVADAEGDRDAERRDNRKCLAGATARPYARHRHRDGQPSEHERRNQKHFDVRCRVADRKSQDGRRADHDEPDHGLVAPPAPDEPCHQQRDADNRELVGHEPPEQRHARLLNLRPRIRAHPCLELFRAHHADELRNRPRMRFEVRGALVRAQHDEEVL
jgi:hypothetical protein